MFTKIWQALDGYKTYTLAGLGILVALCGHFWGPIALPGGTAVPQMSWNEVWSIAWNSGLFAALRHGMEPSHP